MSYNEKRMHETIKWHSISSLCVTFIRNLTIQSIEHYKKKDNTYPVIIFDGHV